MRVVVSGNLMRFTGYAKEVELEASTVGSALDALVERHPALRPVLFDGEGRVRSVHRLYLDGDGIEGGDLASIPVAAGDELVVLTALAGG